MKIITKSKMSQIILDASQKQMEEDCAVIKDIGETDHPKGMVNPATILLATDEIRRAFSEEHRAMP